MRNSLLSVVCCVHNGEEYLHETISSILQDSFSDFEVLIVNDGSTDSTGVILEEFRRSDFRINVLTREHQGLTKSLIEACLVCKGELIARIDCGDLSYPTRFSTQTQCFREDSDLVLCGSQANVIDRRGLTIGVNRCYTPRPDIAFMTWNPFVHSSVMFRKCAYHAVGGYRAEIRYSQDYDLWTRISTQGRIVIIKDQLVGERLDSRGLSFSGAHKQIFHGTDIAWTYSTQRLKKSLPQEVFCQHFSLLMAPGKRPPLSWFGALTLLLRQKDRLFFFSSMRIEHKLKWGLFFLLGRALFKKLFSIYYLLKYRTQ